MRHWAANQFRTFRKVHAWWREQLTTMGKVVFLVMVCTLPTFADSGAVLAIAFIASSIMLLVATSTSYLYRSRLAIQVTCPRKWMQSQSRVVRLKLTNRSRLPIYDLHLQLLPEPGIWEIIHSQTHIRAVPPGGTVTFTSTVKSLRRGLFRLPRLQATTLFPLQLVQRAEQHLIERKALILPFYRELRSLDLAQHAPDLARGNSLALQTVGLTGEYVGSREYQPGVPVRKWDYASWARLGQPVIREFSEPRHPSVAIAVDTFFDDTQLDVTEPLPQMESILSLAAAISEALIVQGNRIELLTVGDRLFADRERLLGGDHMAILEHLALAQARPREALSMLLQDIQMTPATWDLAIVLSHRWDAGQEQLYERLTRHRVAGTRVLVGHNAAASTSGTRHGDFSVISTSQIEAGTVDL